MTLYEWMEKVAYAEPLEQDYEYWSNVEDQCYNDSFDEDEAA